MQKLKLDERDEIYEQLLNKESEATLKAGC